MKTLRLAVVLLSGVVGEANAQRPAWQLQSDARLAAGYFAQNTRAGERGLTTSSWLMLDVRRTSGAGHVGAHAMFSADAVINGECGQPRILPESFECGDGQMLSHPLLMTLGALGEFRLRTAAVSWGVYAVGEPAFGPAPHFMRASAAFENGQPFSHHFFNPVHSAHGVLTLGVRRGALHAEASAFNTRLLSDRYRISLAAPRGRAGRITWRPAEHLALQLSAAYLPAEEGSEHHTHSGDMRAYSVSVSGRAAGMDYTVGCAVHRTMQQSPTACLTETTWSMGAHRIFGRVEGVNRLVQNLEAVVQPDGSHLHVVRVRMLKTGEVAGGYSYALPTSFVFQPALGVSGSVTFVPEFFRLRYREARATSINMFLSLQPRAAQHQH